MVEVVIAGGGVSGLYFAYRLLSAVPDVKATVVDPKPYHEFLIGVPMAFGGLVEFDQLKFPFSSMGRIRHVQSEVVEVAEDGGFKLADGSVLRGDYNVLAVGSVRLGPETYFTVDGAKALYEKVKSAKAVRFIVDETYPVIGFQEIAIAVKSLWRSKEVSIHMVYVHPDYRWLFELHSHLFREFGIPITDEPPASYSPGELLVTVPSTVLHPLARGLALGPLFETQYPNTYLIGESSLIKLRLPPLGWGAIWQASLLASAIASEIRGGYAEVEADEWTALNDPDRFKQYFTLRMSKGIPLVALRGLYELWRSKVVGTLSGSA
ncbi:MAG: NAD(P)/FAD-dependent oxidoreductase [Thermoproteus sp. AZ2]|uniref:NAD(P)/FAD-dependent oxidoreductase n=1 Tax=Thermoproteus sp. AZ2 TaxID=1609232 RepID=A0ACC6V1U6_9CREN|nr:MAG: pyridine nucleotide-disulfide oxidoreductase [Thermoproteus sp. AZ2]